jgi:hypothetical protein
MLLKVTRRLFLFATPRMIEPGAGKTDGQSTKHAQDGQAAKGSNSASIFVQRGVQSLMELSFNAPVLSATMQEVFGGPLLGIGAGDHGPGFASCFAVLEGAALQFSDLCRRHKADLFRTGVLQA